MEFCDDLETDQVGTRDGNTRGVMGWGRGASEDLSRLYLFLCYAETERGRGLQQLCIVFTHSFFSHTHSRCISEFITPTLFSYHFLTLAIGIAFFVFALFTVVGTREEYSYRFHDAELFFLVFTFPLSSFLANFFWIIFTFFQFFMLSASFFSSLLYCT